MTKWIYSFGDGDAEGNKNMKDLLGGKGANLAEMCHLKLPVPPGFTITSEMCGYYYSNNQTIPNELDALIHQALQQVEHKLGKRFGDSHNPLLVSVRSGASVSMPGMMETILNLGLNDETVKGLALTSGNERFAFDSYRRFIQMYANVVLNIDSHEFEDTIDLVKQDSDITNDIDLSPADLQRIIEGFKEIVKDKSGNDFPQDVYVQLKSAIKAVLDSWMCGKALTYRRLNNISQALGTAVTVQSMVFGNMGDRSATGVLFTRNPSTGENTLYGEFLANAQGEDVVAGIRTPQALTRASASEPGESLEETMPDIYEDLAQTARGLELHYKDMQDIEFTVEQGKLWILQTRSGKRTAQSALKIAVDLVQEGMIDKATALKRINPESLDQILHPTLDPKATKVFFAKGLPASPGAASGMAVFSAEEAERLTRLGEKTILVRSETSPEDIGGMYAAQGILTSRGGMTSHAAVVARGMGRPCIAGASRIHVDYTTRKMKAGNIEVKHGEFITIDGTTGEVILGHVPTIPPALSDEFRQVMQWADEVRKLRIRTNAETSLDTSTALGFGCEGIGLCRTEHMFFEGKRITSVRKMIVAHTQTERQAALDELMPMQKQDFIEILTLMQTKPVNIRLLDMPLHEFLPHTHAEIEELAHSAHVDVRDVTSRVKELSESNPMLGHRGSRIGITYPEIYQMQAKAIFEAMVHVNKHASIQTNVEVMVPLIATEIEMQFLRDLIEDVAQEVQADNSCKLTYQIGTMIELPRAALLSDKIAKYADYMSYGTNDLSQTTFGISRDDAGSFIPDYIESGIFAHDPFVRLDTEGVGELIKISAERARSTRANIKLGVCGEHGGNPESIAFFHGLGFDYVSCSPYRIPVARLAAAQAALLNCHPRG